MTALKQLFSASYEKSDVSTKVPWHVVEQCYVVVDMSSFCSKMDLAVDSWNWILPKTYVVSAESRVVPYKKRSLATHFRIVKIIYKCQGNDNDNEKHFLSENNVQCYKYIIC